MASRAPKRASDGMDSQPSQVSFTRNYPLQMRGSLSYSSAAASMRRTTKPLYVRVDIETHEALALYARRYGYTLNDVVHILCAVMLVQVDPDYTIPEFL